VAAHPHVAPAELIFEPGIDASDQANRASMRTSSSVAITCLCVSVSDPSWTGYKLHIDTPTATFR
jgi:hypothetical protein